jgi:outer membrane receptor protein involved in Fe transport
VQPEDLEEYSQITGGENLYNTIIAEGSDDPYVAGLTRARIVRTDVLPAAAFTWSMSDHTKLRLAASKTVARPSFKEIAPVPFLDIFDNVIFIGNRRLQMSSITNYDVRYEYGNGKQTAAASLFTKMIDNPIELENGAVRRFANVDNGQVYGMELEYQGSLGFVADELEDISVGFNYSKIFSRAERTRPIFGDASRRLQGQPDYILNFNIGYDNKDWGLYTGIFLNVTGQMLALAGVNEEYPDIYQMPVSTLDWSISKKLGKSAKLTFRAANLLDAEFERRYGVGDQKVFSSFQRGRNYSFSVGIDW